MRWRSYIRELILDFENMHFRGITMTLLFSFCPDEMGKEYKYLKNMFHLYQVRFRAPWWIMRVREAGLILADDSKLGPELLPRKSCPEIPSILGPR